MYTLPILYVCDGVIRWSVFVHIYSLCMHWVQYTYTALYVIIYSTYIQYFQLYIPLSNSLARQSRLIELQILARVLNTYVQNSIVVHSTDTLFWGFGELAKHSDKLNAIKGRQRLLYHQSQFFNGRNLACIMSLTFNTDDSHGPTLRQIPTEGHKNIHTLHTKYSRRETQSKLLFCALKP